MKFIAAVCLALGVSFIAYSATGDIPQWMGLVGGTLIGLHVALMENE